MGSSGWLAAAWRARLTACPSKASRLELAIEFLGEFPGGPIGYCPQRSDECGGSGFKELGGPAIEPVVGRVEPGAAASVDENSRRGAGQDLVDSRRRQCRVGVNGTLPSVIDEPPPGL